MLRASISHPLKAATHMQQVCIADMIDPARIDPECRITSKKRLMEHIAALLARHTDIDEQAAFRVLIERERLGSTGVGDGIALPHGRIAGIDDAVLALATLSEPLDYQAPDRQKVSIAVGLLVPENANETHLQILAHLAQLLSQAGLRQRLRQANTADEILSALKDAETR